MLTMDTNNQNIFGNLKSNSGGITCGACFQEFASFNDLILHERLHIEQMSLASLQAHLLPQYNNRASMVASNFPSVSTNVQNDSQTLVKNSILKDAGQANEHVKRPSSIVAADQDSGISQLDLSKTSVQYCSPVNHLKEPVSPVTDVEAPDLQAQKTHIELKTPTYMAVPYGRDFQPAKPLERRGSQNISKSYNSDDVPLKVAGDSPDIAALRGQQEEKYVAEELYKASGIAAEKTVTTTKSDFTVSGIIQPDSHTTVYDLANINKPVQFTNYESAVEKPLFEAIPFYYENFNVEGVYATKKQVTDFSIQTLSNGKPNTTQTVVPTTVDVVLPLNVPSHSSVSNITAKQTYTTQAAEQTYVTDYSIQALSCNKSFTGETVIPQHLPSYSNVQVLGGVHTNAAVTVPTFVQTSVAGYNVQTGTKAATTHTILPIAVSDYNKQPVHGNINQVNNIQYQVQLPMSTIKQLPQYQYAFGPQQGLSLPVQVIEMPVSAKYVKKETETGSVSQSPQMIYSGIPAYVQTTLSYTPPTSINSSLYKPGQLPVDPQISEYHAYQAPLQESVNYSIKGEAENHSQSQYQFTAVPVSNYTSSAIEFTQTLSKSYSDTVSTVKSSSVTIPPRALTEPTAALPKQIVTPSSSPSKRQLTAVRLSDGTYYPEGLPFPKKVNTSATVCAGYTENVPDNVKTMEKEPVVNKTSEIKDESSKQKEFVDMIKMVQGQRSFKRKYEHLNESSDSENNDSEDYKVDIVCFICSEEFEKRKKLYKHLQKHRKCGELSAEEETDDDDGKRKQKNLCKYCGRQFMRLPHLVEHIRKHTAEKPFDCRFCSRAYGNKLRCTRHEATHNNDEVGIHCEICECETETKAFYLYHMNEHVLDENKKLEEDKQQQFVEMIRNMQSNKNNEREKIENTEDQMLNLLLDFEKDKNKSNLANEEIVQEVPETVPCRICPEKVVKKDFLNHFQSHKIYLCKVCKRGFTNKLNYKYHSDTMHYKEETNEHASIKKTFVCTICEKRLSKKSKLKMHLQTHVSDEPLLKCEICQEPFHNKGDYFYHLSQHNDKDAAELVESEKREKGKSQAQSKKGLKIKISDSKAPNVEKLDQTHAANELSDRRELRQRDTKKMDYSWHGLLEENLKTSVKDSEKGKLPKSDSENKSHTKRNRKQVDRYSETLDESSTHHKNIRKRKLLNYKASNYGEQSHKPESKETDLNPANNEVKKPGEVGIRLSELMKCKVCNKSLSKLDYIEHFRSHFLLTCEECQRSFVRKNTFISHYKNVHETEISEEFVDKELVKFQENKLIQQKEKKDAKLAAASELKGNHKLPEINNKRKIQSHTNKQIITSPIQPQIMKSQVSKQTSISLDSKQDATKNKEDSQKIGYMFESGTENPFVCTRCNRRFIKQCGVISHLKMHANADSHRKKVHVAESGVPNFVKIKADKVLKEPYISAKQSNLVNSDIVPKSKYFCEICQKTIAQRHNYETHMKAKHKNEKIENEVTIKGEKRLVENEPKLKLGVDVKSPPKKRKIFVDDVYDQGITTSETNHHFTSKNSEENKTKAMFVKGPENVLNGKICNVNTCTSFHSSQSETSQALQQASDLQAKGETRPIDKADIEKLVLHSKNLTLKGKPGKLYPQFCPVCRQEQTSHWNYTEHLRSHTGERPYHCQKCLQTFSRDRNLKAHLKNCHPEEAGLTVVNNTVVDEKCEDINVFSKGSDEKIVTFIPKRLPEDKEIARFGNKKLDHVENRTTLSNQSNEETQKTRVDSRVDKNDRKELDPVEKVDTSLNGMKVVPSNQLNENAQFQTSTGSNDYKTDLKELDYVEKPDTSVNGIEEVSQNHLPVNEKTQTQTSTGSSKTDEIDTKELDPVERLETSVSGMKDNDLETSGHGKDILREIVLSNSAFKKCPVCFMKIYSTKLYEKHLKSHPDCLFFSCKSCDLSFESQEQLYNHKKIHLIEKPILNANLEYSSDDRAISKCVKRFTKPVDMKNVYNNPQDLVCRLCHANFMTKSAYDIHLQVHVDEDNDADESSNDSDDVGDLMDSWEQNEDVQLGIGDKKGDEYVIERGSVDSLKQDNKVKYISEIIADATDKGNEVHVKENYNFTGSHCNDLSINKFHGTLSYEKKLTENDYLKNYGVHGFKYNVKAHLINELINGANICANSDSEIVTKSNDLDQSSTKMNMNEGTYIQNMINQNDISQGVLQQSYDKNLTSDTSQADYLIHNPLPPKATESLVMNDVMDGTSHNWSDCVPTLPFSDNVNWQDKLQSEFMYSNARTLSQHVRPDSVEYGCARNYDT